MKFVDSCIICDSDRLTGYPAIVSPFIAQLALKRPSMHCMLYECVRCAHRFFDLRLDEREMASLYSHYRDENYLKLRQRWEPWYTAAVNQSIGNDPVEIGSRRSELLKFLQKHLSKEVLTGVVLDYGGDRGQFLPLELGSQKYVFEVSDQRPAEGVVRLISPAEIQAHRPDIVLLCHVFEHMPSPREFLQQVRAEIGAKSNYWLYVEVPQEGYPILRSAKDESHRMKRGQEAAIFRHRFAWILSDFYSTFCRVKFRVVPPFGIIKLHEHLNFFSEESIRILLQQAGFLVEVVASGSFSSRSGISRVIRVLARSQTF
jgi:hypothetical protein